MRQRARLAVSGICGVLAAVMAVGYADVARAEVEAERAQVLERYGGEVASLVVAREGLKAGEVVAEGDVEVREWLVDLAPEGALENLDDVVGLRLSSNVAAGTPLSEVCFASEDGALEVPEGMVAISVKPTDKTGVTADIAAGTRLLAYEVDKEGATRLLSSEVSVIAAGAAGAQGGSAGVLALACAPEDVAQVLSASAAGTLRLVVPAADVDLGEIEAAGPAASPGAMGRSDAGAAAPAEVLPEEADAGAGEEPAGPEGTQAAAGDALASNEVLDEEEEL